jgi:hypothetical protein
LGEVEGQLDRLKKRARPDPMTRATMKAGGETRNSPTTTGSSLIENEWALRPMWRWMTLASARKKPAAIIQTGIVNGRAIGGSDGTMTRARPTVTTVSRSVNSHTRITPEVPATNSRNWDLTGRAIPSSAVFTWLSGAPCERTRRAAGRPAGHRDRRTIETAQDITRTPHSP